MGKKTSNNPESLKEAGNRAFANGSFEQSVKLYTQAIDRLQTPSHLYLSNRANAFLMLERNSECISDCDLALKIEPTFMKAYLRKIDALINLQKLQEALEVIKVAQKIQPQNEDLQKFLKEVEYEIECDKKLPEDHKVKQDFRNLSQWMKDGGSKVQKCKIRYFTEDFRGVCATQKIKPGEILAYLSHHQLITPHTVISNKDAKECLGMKFFSSKPENMSIIMFVLLESRNEFSRFNAYLSGFPKSFEEYPICFKDEEMELLKGSPLHNQVLTSRNALKKDYETLTKKFENLEFTYQEFVNAKIAVQSRIFGVKIKGKDTVAMVPYADMYNHNRPCQTTWYYDDNLKGFCIKAKEEIERGDQIYDTYGMKSNADFFCNYGFLIPENERNTYAIRIQLKSTDPQYYIKCLLAKALYPSQQFLCVETLDDKLMFKFVSWVRFVVFDEDQDIDHKTKINLEAMIRNQDIQPISVKTEIKLWERVKEIANENLLKYDTTYEEDMEILKQEMSYQAKNCVTLRSGEKKILRFLIKTADLFIKICGMTKKEAKLFVHQFEDFTQWFYYYKLLNALLLE